MSQALRMLPSSTTTLPFLLSSNVNSTSQTGLIILNQSTSRTLLERLWKASSWHCCADGGANRLYDTLGNDKDRLKFLPELIKGDLDSLREDVHDYYLDKGVEIIREPDQYTTDLQKCLASLSELEKESNQKYTVLLLGGLSGRLDQTIHTLSLLHKLRKTHPRIFAITDDNIGWVLDSGEHTLHLDLELLGPTCGLLPVGINETTLSTRGLEWNLDNTPSSFNGLISTSNHLVDSEVWVKTTKPIWWCVELKTNL